MALFGLFGKKDEGAAIRRIVGKLTQKFGQPEDRQAAAQRLLEMGTQESYTALLQRFTMHAEPSIVDEEQKQYVCDAFVEAGEGAIEPLKSFVMNQEVAPTWALRSLERMLPPAELVDLMLAALDKQGSGYTRYPDKKITLLNHLESHDDPRIPARIVAFIEDTSEDVRIAALGVLQLRPDEVAREPMIRVLLQAVEEKSERLRRAAAEALAKSGFSVKGQRPAVEAALPPGFSLDKEVRVRAK